MAKPMSITCFDNARAFLDVAGPLLYEKEAVNSLMLGICERLVRIPDAYKNPFFAVVRDETGTVRFAVIMTPPHNMVLADGKNTLPAIPFLMDNLLDRGLPIPGVTGPVHLVEAFTARWRSVTGQEFEVLMRQRVYELREVRMPPIPSGHFRVARSEDIPTIIDWYKTFVAEAMNMTTTLTEEEAGRWVDDGNIFVWDLEGDSVSIAMKTRPITHSISVSFVYTPPEHRRQGYASALVARLSQHLLDLGFESVTLFTDLDFPTSNAIYQKIGYQPVTDFRMVKFIERS